MAQDDWSQFPTVGQQPAAQPRPTQRPAPRPSGPVYGAPKPKETPSAPSAPSGYRFTPGGGLEPIPGGPADKPEEGGQPPSGYRWRADGGLEPIPGGPAVKGASDGSLDPKTQEGQRNIARNIFQTNEIEPRIGGHDPIEELIGNSTSGGLQYAGATIYGDLTGEATDGMEAIGALKTISSDMTLQMAGGSLGAGFSNTDRQFIEERMGDIANPRLPASQRIAAWRQVKGRLIQLGAYDESGAVNTDLSRPGDGGGIGNFTVQGITADLPPAGPPGPPAPAPLPQGARVNVGQTGGRPVNMEATGQVYTMWKSGASYEEINAYLGSIGKAPFDFSSPRAQAAMKYGEENADYNPFIVYDNPTQQQPEQPAPEQSGGILQGMKAGVGDLVQGAGDMLGVVGNPLNATVNSIFGTNLSTNLGETLRTDVAGIEHGNPTAEAINRGAVGALTGSVAARGAATVANPGVYRNALQSFGSTPGRDMVGGATAGASADYARQQGYGPVGQAGAALVGGVAGYGGANALTPRPRVSPTVSAPRPAPVAEQMTPAAQQQIVQAGKREGVRVMTTDVKPPSTVVGRTARLAGENVPFAGTSGPRSAQQTERVAAVQRLAADYGVDASDDAIGAVSKDLARTRGKELTTLTNAKDSVIDGTPGAVEAPRTIAAIDEQIAKLSGANAEAFAPVISKLEGFKQVLSSGRTLREVEMNRRLLGDLFQDPNLASIKGDGQKALNAVYAPLREDMGAFIKATAGNAAHGKWKAANDKLSAMAGELQVSSFKRVLQSTESTPENVASLLFNKKPSEVERLVSNLSDAGKIKARAAVIGKALDGASDGENISPDKFANAMSAMSASLKGVFEGADLERVEGLVRLIKATKRASTSNAEVMTGARNTGVLLAGVSGATLGKYAIPLGLVAGGGARAYESKVVRDLLLSLSRTKPGSPSEQKVLMRLTDVMPRFALPLNTPANDITGVIGNSTTAAAAENPPEDSRR